MESDGGVRGNEVSVDPKVEDRKLFLGGLAQDTTEESLREHFEAFGKVEEVVIMKDPITKRSRGFGFVTFECSHSAHAVIRFGRKHKIYDKEVEVKAAYRKGEEALVQSLIHDKKLFIGGLTEEMKPDIIKEYFENFQSEGKVTDVDLKRDKYTGSLRGFGFIDFGTKRAADAVLSAQYHYICGKKIEVKPADPKGRSRPDKPNQNQCGLADQLENRTSFFPYSGPYPSNYGAGFGAVENSYVSNGGLIGNAGNMYGNNAGFISTGYGVLSPNRGHAPQQFTYPQGKHGPINEGFGHQPTSSNSYGNNFVQTKLGGLQYTPPQHGAQLQAGYPPNVSSFQGYQPSYNHQEATTQRSGYGHSFNHVPMGGYYGGQ